MEAEILIWPYVRQFAYIPSQRFTNVIDMLQAVCALCTTLSYFLLSFLIIRHSPPRKRANLCFLVCMRASLRALHLSCILARICFVRLDYKRFHSLNEAGR